LTWITPSFLIQPLVPIYVAWLFFMFRFYLMPWLLGDGHAVVPAGKRVCPRCFQPGGFLRQVTAALIECQSALRTLNYFGIPLAV